MKMTKKDLLLGLKLADDLGEWLLESKDHVFKLSKLSDKFRDEAEITDNPMLNRALYIVARRLYSFYSEDRAVAAWAIGYIQGWAKIKR